MRERYYREPEERATEPACTPDGIIENQRATAVLDVLRVFSGHLAAVVAELPTRVRNCDVPPIHELRSVAHAATAVAKMAEAAEEALYG